MYSLYRITSKNGIKQVKMGSESSISHTALFFRVFVQRICEKYIFGANKYIKDMWTILLFLPFYVKNTMIIANSLSFWRSYFIIYYPFCDFTTILLLISWIIVFTIFLRNHYEATFSQVIFEFTMIIMILLSFMRIHYYLTTIMAN